MNIGFISIKGGVGKTTLALETASSLANDFGKKVMLVDANFSAPNLSSHLGLEPELTLHDVLLNGSGLHKAVYERHGFDVVPAAIVYKHEIDVFRLKRILDKIKDRYDFIILDSSPHYSEMMPVVAAADKLFVVTTPDIPTLTMSMKAAHLARNQNTPIEGVIVNKIRNNRHELNLNEIESGMDLPVVAKINDDARMIEAIHSKTPLNLQRPESSVSREIKRFAAALCGEPGESGGLFNIGSLFSNWIGKEKVNRDLMRQKFYESQM